MAGPVSASVKAPRQLLFLLFTPSVSRLAWKIEIPECKVHVDFRGLVLTIAAHGALISCAVYTI